MRIPSFSSASQAGLLKWDSGVDSYQFVESLGPVFLKNMTSQDCIRWAIVSEGLPLFTHHLWRFQSCSKGVACSKRRRIGYAHGHRKEQRPWHHGFTQGHVAFGFGWGPFPSEHKKSWCFFLEKRNVLHPSQKKHRFVQKKNLFVARFQVWVVLGVPAVSSTLWFFISQFSEFFWAPHLTSRSCKATGRDFEPGGMGISGSAVMVTSSDTPRHHADPCCWRRDFLGRVFGSGWRL